MGRTSFSKLTLAALAATVVGTLLGSSGAMAQVRRDILIDSHCNRELRILIEHSDSYRSWHPHGWWTFSPMEGPKALVYQGNRLGQLSDHSLYIYAETTDGSRVWQGDDSSTVYEGTRYNLLKTKPTVASNGLVVKLTCS